MKKYIIILVISILFLGSIYSKNSYKYYFDLGNKKYEEEDFDKAIENYNISIKLNQKHSDSYFMKANAEKNLNLINEALADYNIALHLNPKGDIGYFNRGVLYFENENFNEAKKDFDKAISLNPEYQIYYIYQKKTEDILKTNTSSPKS
jgi:tetratricopeptide (TPR) repeat protein